MIIDCHTHAYPPEVAKDPRGWAEARDEMHWADLVAPPDRPSIQGWSTPETMLSAMDAAGVDQAILLGWYWEHESTCRWHNEVMADWIRASGGRLKAFASITPNENVIDQLESAKVLGFCGVGEMHIGVQSIQATDPNWRRLTDWCQAHRWPINLHATETAGHEHPGSVPTPLQRFVEIAENAPNLKIILAHWGGGLAFFEQNPRLQMKLKNVYYDAAASPLLYDVKVLARMRDLVGIEKLLFGSDYPLRIYPRTTKVPEMRQYIQQIVEQGDLSPADREKFFGSNWQHLIM